MGATNIATVTRTAGRAGVLCERHVVGRRVVFAEPMTGGPTRESSTPATSSSGSTCTEAIRRRTTAATSRLFPRQRQEHVVAEPTTAVLHLTKAFDPSGSSTTSSRISIRCARLGPPLAVAAGADVRHRHLADSTKSGRSVYSFLDTQSKDLGTWASRRCGASSTVRSSPAHDAGGGPRWSRNELPAPEAL